MKRSLFASALLLGLSTFLSSCDDDHHNGEETDVVGRVVLAGFPISGANVRIIFNGFVVDTEVTQADGTFHFDDYPEFWDPFFVEAFYIDPVSLIEYKGVTPFFLTNESGNTNVGDIVLVQQIPFTAGEANTAQADLDGDSIQDVVASFPGAVVAWSSGGGVQVLAVASEDEEPFGLVTLEDVDGDGYIDASVTREPSGAIELFRGDGAGKLKLP